VSRLPSARARGLFGAARVARLATLAADGPHLVPIVFELAGDTVYSAVDHKPKRTTALRRLANVIADPAVGLLVDHYDDADWTALWWARAEGTGRVLEPEWDEARAAVDLLIAKYPQHRREPPSGPVLAIDVHRWSGWSAR
jgi:PPOX class probable F420-dependent enzyme